MDDAGDAPSNALDDGHRWPGLAQLAEIEWRREHGATHRIQEMPCRDVPRAVRALANDLARAGVEGKDNDICLVPELSGRSNFSADRDEQVPPVRQELRIACRFR